MAFSYNFSNNNSISIAEYCEWMEANVDFRDEASVLASASTFHQLSNNRTLLEEIITSSLKTEAEGIQQFNVYTDATFILAMSRNKPFFVRANVWKKPQARNGTHDWENQHYSYLLAHDHNFDFMTVGYHGLGYRTEIYEYDKEAISGYIGEKIELRFLEDTRLECGKVMFYRKSKDVHVQHPPEQLSISLNLMMRCTDQHTRQQFEFDVQNSKIKNYLSGDISLRVSLIEMAAELGGTACVDILDRIARTHVCPRSRKAAFTGLLHSATYDQSLALTNIEKDSSIIVRDLLGHAHA